MNFIRNAVLSISLLSFSSNLLGQICFEQNALRIGDKILKQQIMYRDPGNSGENVFWDFSRIEVVDDSYSLSYNACCDTVFDKYSEISELLVGVQHATAYQYLQKKDSLLLLGYYNSILLMNYDSPLLSMVYPLDYGMSVENVYTCSGFYSSEDTIQEKGTVCFHADAVGELLLPSGDTLNHVLRVKTLQTIVHVDSLHVGDMNNKIIVESYSWYACGYRYPIIEFTRSYLTCDSLQQELFRTGFFYAPEEQKYLSSDPINHDLREVNNMPFNRSSRSVEDDFLSEGHPPIGVSKIDYRVCPNPVTDKIYVDYVLKADSEIRIILYNSDGKIQFDSSLLKNEKGTYKLIIPCETLLSGTYVLYIISDFNTITEKLTKTE
ncbi:T9SS type A sorting domain-containing protein [Bacteroides salyersiae]|uniref:T9SS type A sorting domain-containing protein n=1 Tax=Bacteroides salyersiae TaxID=291644 RepID=UPI003DA634C3